MIYATVLYTVSYGADWLSAYYDGSEHSSYNIINRMTGPYWWAYWGMMITAILLPHLFWFRTIRRNFILPLLLLIVQNFERFVIGVTSLHRDYLPDSWAYYEPSIQEFTLPLVYLAIIFGVWYWKKDRSEPRDEVLDTTEK